jgi:hypothetical protein
MTAWAVLMHGLNVHVPWRKVISGYALSFLPRYIPGTVWGYLSRNEWLYQGYNVSYTVSNFGSILEVIAIVCANCMTLGIYFAAVSLNLARFAWIIFVFIFPILVWALLAWGLGQKRIQRRLARNSVNSSFRVAFSNWIMVMLIYIGLWFCYGTLLLIIVDGFGFTQTSGALSVVSYTFMFGLSWLIGFAVIFVPSGLGVRESVLVGLIMANVGLGGSKASLVSVMSRLLVSFSELAWICAGVIINYQPKRD